MPIIAYLEWGLLVWGTQMLPIRRRWLEDGPIIRVDFRNQSDNNLITLVLEEDAAVRSLWKVGVF